jgi:bla regulator protein BlaR1
MSDVLNHLFAGLLAIAAVSLRNNHARARYWLWLAASLKFLVPFSLFVLLGSRVETTTGVPPVPALFVEQITSSFAPVPAMHSTIPRSRTPVWPAIALGVWIAGAMYVMTRWLRKWLTLRRVRTAAVRLPIAAPIPVLASASAIEPGVFGILRPVLLLPEGILQNLSPAELDAIIAHELSHVRRRDNLTGAAHMLVQTIFWFHPMVWWIGAKLVRERERACDEDVLARGAQARVYATGILSVCKYYVESPLFCASGVSGGELRKRITDIMTWRPPMHLTPARKLGLALAGVSVLSAPVAIGILRAQTLPPAPQYRFEVASIKPSKAIDNSNRLGPVAGGGLRAENVTPWQLIGFAFGVRPFQVIGVPGWAQAERFDIMATPDKSEPQPPMTAPREQLDAYRRRIGQRVQALLIERFGLVLREETREMPVYALVIGKSGHKLTATEPGKPPNMQSGNRQVSGSSVAMRDLAFSLAGVLRQPVLDETGLKGLFDFKMEWTPDQEAAEAAGSPAGPSIFTAIQEQLGLKLETKKAPQTVYVIEKMNRPSEN